MEQLMDRAFAATIAGIFYRIFPRIGRLSERETHYRRWQFRITKQDNKHRHHSPESTYTHNK
jgi:hypothetical protein